MLALVDGLWLGIRTLVEFAKPKPKPLGAKAFSRLGLWPQVGCTGWVGRELKMLLSYESSIVSVLDVLNESDRWLLRCSLGGILLQKP